MRVPLPAVAEEAAAAFDATDKDVSIGGAGLAAATIELASSDRVFAALTDSDALAVWLPPDDWSRAVDAL